MWKTIASAFLYPFERVHDFFDSFKVQPGGFSARKLSAFAGVAIAVWSTYQFCTTDVLEGVLMIWLVFALLCMGLVTVNDIIKYRTGSVVTEETKTTETKTTEVKTEPIPQ